MKNISYSYVFYDEQLYNVHTVYWFRQHQALFDIFVLALLGAAQGTFLQISKKAYRSKCRYVLIG